MVRLALYLPGSRRTARAERDDRAAIMTTSSRSRSEPDQAGADDQASRAAGRSAPMIVKQHGETVSCLRDHLKRVALNQLDPWRNH
jgi:hypothetical protein